MTITRCHAINRDIDGDCPGSMCHSARWHSETFRGHGKERIKALLTKKYCKGGSEYSGMFIFKISIFKLVFLRNTKNGHFEPKSDENENNDKYCEKQSYKRRKIRSLLSWQQRTIRHLSADTSGEGSFSGEGVFHGTLPGRKLEEIRALSQEYHGNGGLVPQRLFM